MAFGRVVLKSSSNSSGGSNLGSENRISSIKQFFGWLPLSTWLTVFILCLSIKISGSDWPDRIRWCCPGFLPAFNGKASLNDGTNDEIYSRDLCTLLQTRSNFLHDSDKAYLPPCKIAWMSSKSWHSAIFDRLFIDVSVDSFLNYWLSFSRKCIYSTSFWKYKPFTSVPSLAFWITPAPKSSLLFLLNQW